MTALNTSLAEAKRRVAKIAEIGDDDSEQSHILEDLLYRDVLMTIRDHSDDVDASRLAGEVLRTQDIQFSRWYA